MLQLVVCEGKFLGLELWFTADRGDFEEGDRFHVRAVDLRSEDTLVDDLVIVDDYTVTGDWVCSEDCAKAALEFEAIPTDFDYARDPNNLGLGGGTAE